MTEFAPPGGNTASSPDGGAPAVSDADTSADRDRLAADSAGADSVGTGTV